MSSFAEARTRRISSAGLALALGLAVASAAGAQERPVTGTALRAEPLGIGRTATKAEIAPWDIAVRPDGHGLPEGKGSVKDGEALYLDRCAACHGEFGEGKDRWPSLLGGGKLTDDDPKKGVGNYWPYATTLFDYIRRAMPFGNAQSLTVDETYAITAYVLNLGNVLADDAVLDRAALLAIRMPNAANFVADPRPDTKAVPCMTACRETVDIHSEARKVDVTPTDSRGRKEGDGPAKPRLE